MVKYFYCLIVVFLIVGSTLRAQQSDSMQLSKDSLILSDPTQNIVSNFTQDLLKKNFLINSNSPSLEHVNLPKNSRSKDMLFYLIAGLLFCLGLFRMLNNKYFINIVRVFFNNSLRQSQLVDQLLQVKLPSLFLNLFFATVAGFYIFLNLALYDQTKFDDWQVLSFSIISVMMIYSFKFLSLKFFGWLVDCKYEADTYIFIVFLLNKIIGLLLLPVICIMAFADKKMIGIFQVISYCMIGMMFLLRYVRSYSVLRYSLKVSRFHFILYIIGIEILPIFLIYKQALIILNKNM